MSAGEPSGHGEEDPHVVVDASGLVIESVLPGVVAGRHLSECSWLEGPSGVALAEAALRGRSAPVVARDDATGSHWLVSARVIEDDPWRARLGLVDATAAVMHDRRAIHGKIVHSMQNISFAVLSVVEALELCRPSGAELDPYLVHLRQPADTLAEAMTRLGASLLPIAVARERVGVAEIVGRAIASVNVAIVPSQVRVSEGLAIMADGGLVSEAIAVLLESGGKAAAIALEASESLFLGRAMVAVVLTRNASVIEERAIGAMWELAGDLGFLPSLRLARVRAIALAHDGGVFAEIEEGVLRLGIRLPLAA